MMNENDTVSRDKKLVEFSFLDQFSMGLDVDNNFQLLLAHESAIYYGFWFLFTSHCTTVVDVNDNKGKISTFFFFVFFSSSSNIM
jgi:hypothetical protein